MNTPGAPKKRLPSALKKASSGERSIHPALVPGISVDDTDAKFPTSKSVFAVALLFSAAVFIWAVISPTGINQVGTTMQGWVVENFAWFFGALIVAVTLFMLVIGFAPTGRIPLGDDDSEPDYSTTSWISMLFAAGLGIGLIFYGPMEPLIHFLTPPPGSSLEAESSGLVTQAIAQAILHQASLAWPVYALVGGSIAYASYRRGRLPLISSLFEPVFPGGNNRVLGKIIDIFAVLVTLFGTATSLGIGALQIQTGTSIVTGQDVSGDTFLIIAITLLTVIFIFSAVSGVKKGIRMLSNANMLLVIGLTLFALLAGPTVFLLDLVPATLLTFVDGLPAMLTVYPSEGETEKIFLQSWTTLLWAWWISWSPFVGMFIAKISRGRTLREFVVVVVLVPSGISMLWFIIFGGSTIWQRMNGGDMEIKGSGENVMFDLMGNLPFATITSIIVLIAIVIFFVTAADSATNVMGSMSQSGRTVPSKPVTIIWGSMLGLVAMSLLLAGGQNALSGLQSIMVTCALPFAIILVGVMISWAIDLKNDPMMIRRTYALAAIRKGVTQGIDEHGDDFIFGVTQVKKDEGAGADFDSEDPSLTEWFTDATPDDPEDPDVIVKRKPR
ncbi:Glycine betaine transporter BetP [Corynebacterium faecale]|uniref:BCCT family transporter n=1 Tax=Corynebacterium faecale TaxID=1758466 RepID=UPI0025B32FF8|nr:BCCT family transporter [Corynebacterium faecale]WJY91543.1 Glycine betaine transporter BetP [Corynebacterium faecale]